jgi:nucleoid DNA-binding protein
MGRNPAAGEPTQIKASKNIAFRPAKELKEAICTAQVLGGLTPCRTPLA